MAAELNGKQVAVLATDGVEQVELTEPVKALKAAGATVHVVSPKSGTIQGWNHFDKADMHPVDQALDQADPAAYEALLLPGGVINPDQLRLQPKAIAFIRHFVEQRKPIAAICHGPWTLIDAGGVQGPQGDLLALAADRPAQCRRGMGGPGGGDRPGPRHLPQAGRHPGLLEADDRGVPRGSATAARHLSAPE